MTPESKLERFSAGERFAVDPNAIEGELASLWRAAGASTGPRTPVTRACLWNVVVHIEERPKNEGHGYSESLAQTVRELPRYIAARALVLKTLPDAPDAPELESWISANCIIAGGGGKMVCSEEVAIAARGDGDRHLPALVRALLVPAVPTAVVFAGVPPYARFPIDDSIKTADRLVSNADHSTDPAPLKRLRALAEDLKLGTIDLGWIELSAFRSLVAGLFDPPATEEDARAIDRVKLVSDDKHRWSGQLILAWVAAALGGVSPKAIGHLAWRFSRPGGRPLEIVEVVDRAAPGPAIELVATATKVKYAVRAIQPTMAEVSGPNISTKKPIEHGEPAALLARALMTRSDDGAYWRALRLAAEM